MLIKDILCSDRRREALVRMLAGPVMANEFRPTTTANMNDALRPMIDAGYIRKDGHYYHLTGPGRSIALQVTAMMDAEEVLQSDFWLKHDLSSIPDRLLMRIGELRGGEVVMPNGDLLKAQVNFVAILTHAKRIWGASSFSLPEYPAMITEALENGAEIELILSPACIQALRHEDILAWQATGRFRLHVREVKAALAVADDTLSLGLFDFAGLYDPMQDYVCRSERAAEWGKELFRYYLGE